MWNERGTVASVPWGSCAWMGIFSVWGQSFCCHSQNQRERAEVGTDPPSEGGRGGKQTPLDLKYIERRGRSDISCRSLKLFLTSLPEVKAQAGARWPWFPGSADRPGAVPGGGPGQGSPALCPCAHLEEQLHGQRADVHQTQGGYSKGGHPSVDKSRPNLP